MSLILTTACAQTDHEAAIKKLLEPKLGNEVVVDAVKKTSYAGLYEVQVGGDIFYTDEKAQFLFVGNVMDLKTHKNVTRARLESLNNVKIADLPLELAMKQVKGDGTRVIAVFEDPNCGYCKRLRKEMQKIDNITVYTFMYDILSEDSAIKSNNIWCSANPAQAWNDWMLNGNAAPDAPASCTTSPHEKILALGAKLHITGTPAIFFADGTRAPGFIDANALEKKLADVK
ncbi:DsbC family protein [Solimicrobium silvestre]|nr:DsbC family protein [Solimicrobium silvestre]